MSGAKSTRQAFDPAFDQSNKTNSKIMSVFFYSKLLQ